MGRPSGRRGASLGSLTRGLRQIFPPVVQLGVRTKLLQERLNALLPHSLHELLPLDRLLLFPLGTVRIDPLFQAKAPARAAGASVTFEPGARTAWHTHPLGQTRKPLSDKAVTDGYSFRRP